MLRTVGKSTVVVAVGAASRSFNGLIRLNGTGRFLWEQLKEDKTEEQLLEAMLDAYDISRDVASADIAAFVEKLRAADLLA